ncbi:autotransporter outer membrane beta-barrel domain-containing protein [Reyranella sp.]|uniref:autotransporter family protein n=1 Tax=Reyranella sp. TaxID=1929291 RepID=UPI003BABBFA7
MPTIFARVCRLRRVLAPALGVVMAGVSHSALAQLVPLPPGQVVTGPIGNLDGPSVPSLTTGAAANFYTGSVEGGFIPGAPAAVVKTSVPTQFVRFFNNNDPNTLGPAVGPWIATSNSVRGLTAAQVKNILALPDLPTSVAIINLPAGTCILGGQGNPALGNFPANPPAVPTPGPWGAAGAPQYYIVGQDSGSGCAAPQSTVVLTATVMLNMGTYALAYAPNAGGGNTGSVANALDHAVFPAPFTAMDSVYNSLDLLNFTNPAQLRWALSQLGGEINADLASVSVEAGRNFLDVVGQRLQSVSSATSPLTTSASVTPDGRGQVWFNAAAGAGSIDGDGNSHAFNFNSAVIAAGFDYRIAPRSTLGIVLGFTPSAFSTSGLAGSGSAYGYYAGLYGSYGAGPLYVDAVASFGTTSFSVSRQIAFPGQFGITTAQTNSNAFLSAVEVGYRTRPFDATTVTPFAGLQSVSLWQNAFSEYGAGALNLDVAARSMTSLRSVLGAEVARNFALGDSLGLQARLRLGWAHELAGVDRSIMASFQQLPGASFQVTGAEPSWNAALVGFELSTEGAARLFLRYSGEFSQAQSGHGATVGLTARF